MSYEETLQYLYQALPMFQRVGPVAYKKDLTNTLRLCEYLGQPQQKFRSVHVAGTNGKGSTSHMLAAILQSAGYSTALYTSPHLKSFTERIRVDGKEVDQEFVVRFVERVKPVIEQIQPSFFELTVAMAFEYFAARKVDIAVIEVGLGGRLDSTNVIHPLLSVITNISFDHKELLGDTLPKIAFEKAGIIKTGVPVVISERQPDVEQVFRDRAREVQAPVIFAPDEVKLQRQDGHWEALHHGRPWLYPIHPGLKGQYQQKNIPGVLEAVLQLRTLGINIPDEAILKGLEDVVMLTGLKGRWQVLRQRPLTICDTGHNPAGIREVVEQIQATPHRQLHFVLGAVRDKDLSDMLGLLPKDAMYYFCQAKIPRAMEATSLYELASRQGLQGKVIPAVNDAIREATAAAAPDDLVFIGGSTFVVAEIEGL